MSEADDKDPLLAIDTFIVAPASAPLLDTESAAVEPRYIINGVYVAFDSQDLVPADPSRQRTVVFPHNDYRSARILCRDCGAEFIFSAEEQRVAYEHEKKHPDYFPTRCPTCASLHLQKRVLRKQYDTGIQAALDCGSIADKRAMIATIDKMHSLLNHIPDKIASRREQLAKQIAQQPAG